MGSGISKRGSKKREPRQEIIGSNSSLSSQPQMALFRRQSPESKRRLQHQEYLARESPEPIYDLSRCEISDVPEGTYSLCQVFQKEVLLLHNNWLSSLKGGGTMRELAAIRVLNINDNEISSLPDEISELKCLQVLTVANNRLKKLPDSIGHLQHLQTLDVKGNKLKKLPSSICGMRSLRSLNIAYNRIEKLDKELCHVRTLENLTLDIDDMQYPTPDVCGEGTEAVMRYLCTDCGINYEPPGKFLLQVLEPPKPHLISSSVSNNQLSDITTVDGEYLQYEKIKEKKREEQLMHEKQLAEDQQQQAALIARTLANQQHLLECVEKDQQRFDGELSELQEQQETERKRFIDALCEAERDSEYIVQQLLEMNEQARKTEELMDLMEKERIENEEWWKVRQEEMENLRKNDVINNMEEILAESQAYQEAFARYMETRDDAARRALDSCNQNDGDLERLMEWKQREQALFISQMLKEEAVQKEAFEALQLQRDARHQRLTGQIELIQQELAQLTILEVEQRTIRAEEQQDIIELRRQGLAALLGQLLGERENRAEELKKRLAEMEEQRETDQTDYWLVQYQRLMDMKPQTLIDQKSYLELQRAYYHGRLWTFHYRTHMRNKPRHIEHQEKKLEIAVVEIIEKSGAEEYLPTFARHRITIETLAQMQEQDFTQMGIHQVGLRKALLHNTAEYITRVEEEERAAAKKKGFDEPAMEKKAKPALSVTIPSAPASEPLPSATEILKDVTARGINSECVVCMEHTQPVQPSAPEMPLTPTAPVMPDLVMRSLERTTSMVTARGLHSECVVCMDNRSVVLFLNCGHVCCCEECAKPITDCPLCRSPIVQRIRLSVAPH